MILYLHGFASGPGSTKARYLAGRFAAEGLHIAVPDMTPGPQGFERSTPSSMLAVAEQHLQGAPGPHALVGSSLGGYLAALAAGRNPGVDRLVLLAPAFRLAERWNARLSPDQLRRWQEEGLETHHFASGRIRRIGFEFLEDAMKWPAYPEVRVPTLCITGRRDELIPVPDVERFVEMTPGARLIVVDDGHELTESLHFIWGEIREFLGRDSSR